MQVLLELVWGHVSDSALQRPTQATCHQLNFRVVFKALTGVAFFQNYPFINLSRDPLL